MIFYIVLGILSLIYGIFLKLRAVTFWNFFVFTGFIILAICIFLQTASFKSFKHTHAFKLIKALFIIFLIIFLFVETLIIINGNEKNLSKTDYAIVLGAGVRGKVPSLTLRQRLEAALEYNKANPKSKIILSGGQGPGEDITEAEAMRNWLTEKGINESLLVLENKSKNTKENLIFSRNIIKQTDSRDNIKLTIITSDFHMLRAKILAKRLNFSPYGIPSKSAYWLIPNYYIREFFALVKTVIIK